MNDADRNAAAEEMQIRDCVPGDADFVTRLNEVNVEVLSPMDAGRFRYFM